MRTGDRPRKCRKQREAQTSKASEWEEDDGASLVSVLRSIPLPDCIAFVWSRLGWQERRALRGTSKALKEISGEPAAGDRLPFYQTSNQPPCMHAFLQTIV